MKVRALWHQSASHSEILDENVPEEGKKQLLIESLFSLVSLGTERTVALGLVPPDIREQMRVPYMEGTFLLPCKYGYSLAGRVIRGPDNLKNRFVHVMHPHQDKAWVDSAFVFPLPHEIPPQRAVLAGNLETAVNALWDSEISVGDSILIAGFGLIGALIAMLASDIPGVSIAVHETNDNRRKMAVQFGFQLFDNSKKGAGSFDAAFNTTGNDSALQLCIDHTGYESMVTEVSFYGTNRVSLHLGGNFHTSRKKIVVSQVSNIPGKKLSRWDAGRRKRLVFDLLKNSRFDALVENTIPFSHAPHLFNLIRNGSVNEISVVLKYS
jgi:threonine dehydrogenase-like Zn-dependent dehydrogenase